MKSTPRLKKNLRNATPFLLVILLAIAVPAAVIAQGPPGTPGGPGGGPIGGPPSDPATATPAPTAPVGPPPNPGPSPGNGPPGSQPTATPAPTATAAPGNNQPHPGASFTPPANCIVAHAATPAQVCPIGGGLQYYYIGANGSSRQGPWIAPFSQLTASVFSGTNPLTGKSVTITYLAAENKIRISTFYPDNQYDVNKPYNFTVDASNNVSHEAW